ncbi:MAG: hypothetical protein ACC612_09565 [Methanomethylovorans sp.]|uniref:hypothetical protein n=1 Tax=Methanomethylovorans sp. TaxID=2758717 RepID=UPI003530B6B4
MIHRESSNYSNRLAVGHKELGGKYTQKKIIKSIAVLSVAMMVVCMIPATLAAQNDSQQQSMQEIVHGKKINSRGPAGFSLDNETFEVQQERMLEQINDTISKIEAGEIEDENVTVEMLDNATTQLEEAKTIVENAKEVEDLREAAELMHSAMETLGIEPENRHGMFREEESFETQQERMLEQINDTISFISLINSGEIDDENITAEMLENVTVQLEEAKTIIENAQDEEDLKEARELVHSAMETLGMGPAMMDKPENFPEDETFETQQERMLEQVNNTISKIEEDIENIDELDNENITEEMLTTALTQLEKVKTLITNAEDEEGLKEAVEQMHSAMEELGIRPTNERRMKPRLMEKAGIAPENESSEA